MKNIIALSVVVIALVGGSFSAHADSQDGFGVPSAEQTENTFGIQYPETFDRVEATIVDGA